MVVILCRLGVSASERVYVYVDDEEYFCVHVCGLSEERWPTLMLPCLLEFHTAHKCTCTAKMWYAFTLFLFQTE